MQLVRHVDGEWSQACQSMRFNQVHDPTLLLSVSGSKLKNAFLITALIETVSPAEILDPLSHIASRLSPPPLLLFEYAVQVWSARYWADISTVRRFGFVTGGCSSAATCHRITGEPPRNSSCGDFKVIVERFRFDNSGCFLRFEWYVKRLLIANRRRT